MGLLEMHTLTVAMVIALRQLYRGLLALKLWWRVRCRKLFYSSHTRIQLILVPSSELEPTAVHLNERGGEGGRIIKPGTCSPYYYTGSANGNMQTIYCLFIHLLSFRHCQLLKS